MTWAAEELGLSLTDFIVSTAMRRAVSVVDVDARMDEFIKLAAEAEGLTVQQYQRKAAINHAAGVLKALGEDDVS